MLYLRRRKQKKKSWKGGEGRHPNKEREQHHVRTAERPSRYIKVTLKFCRVAETRQLRKVVESLRSPQLMISACAVIKSRRGMNASCRMSRSTM